MASTGRINLCRDLGARYCWYRFGSPSPSLYSFGKLRNLCTFLRNLCTLLLNLCIFLLTRFSCWLCRSYFFCVPVCTCCVPFVLFASLRVHFVLSAFPAFNIDPCSYFEHLQFPAREIWTSRDSNPGSSAARVSDVLTIRPLARINLLGFRCRPTCSNLGPRGSKTSGELWRMRLRARVRKCLGLWLRSLGLQLCALGL